jgi:5-formyltetrahydrofolate cyclo-ligase
MMAIPKTWMPGTRPGMMERAVSASDTKTSDQKSQLRTEVLSRRDALPPAVRAAGAQAIAARPFPVAFERGMIVSGFSPMRSEINPVPLIRKLVDAGARLALPAIAGRGKALIMRAWNFGEPLAPGQWGIREPMPEAPEVAPDILIVPLAAFDRTGHRIGYGAGYFDMTINALRAKKPVTAVGIAFAIQEILSVPATERDARLDLVLTEREVLDFRET